MTLFPFGEFLRDVLGRLGLLRGEGPAETGSPGRIEEYCDFGTRSLAGGSGFVGPARTALPDTCRRKSASTAPMLDEVEWDHLLILRFGERVRFCAVSLGDSSVAASRVEKCWCIESELVGLGLEKDARCPVREPGFLTVVAAEETEFDRDTLRVAAGAKVGTFIMLRCVWCTSLPLRGLSYA